MTVQDAVGDLVLLCRAAAEAGEDWRDRLHSEWVPATVGARPRAAIVSALHEWDASLAPDDLAGALEGAVLAAMAEDGYD